MLSNPAGGLGITQGLASNLPAAWQVLDGAKLLEMGSRDDEPQVAHAVTAWRRRSCTDVVGKPPDADPTSTPGEHHVQLAADILESRGLESNYSAHQGPQSA